MANVYLVLDLKGWAFAQAGETRIRGGVTGGVHRLSASNCRAGPMVVTSTSTAHSCGRGRRLGRLSWPRSFGIFRLVIAGDSAGGGLALELLLLTSGRAQTEDFPKALAALLMSPWIDLALTGNCMTSRAGADPLLTREELDGAAQLYLGDHDRRDPRTSPLYGNMSGLPRSASRW